MQHPDTHRTAASLRTIRELWGELLLAIATPPADVWPPRQLAQTLHAVDDELLVVERAPLVLREHPAPLNLTALDTGLAIERALFALADTLAAAVQRATARDARRWDYQDPDAVDIRRAHGSRAHGLHFASVWIEGRVLDEDTEPEQQLDGTFVAAPFSVLPEYLLHEARHVVQGAEARLLRTLGLDQRTTPVPDRPCPWCGGELELHTGPDEAPSVTCSTGIPCTAPVPLDAQRRRIWEWGDLPPLVTALAGLEQPYAGTQTS
ncbi:hypothetical protein GCM10010329_17220 [Streptomyces spiroverticillatus]|uniref:LigA protein n=1 Tax=Streptomyces finlayi TaxID=67296 RepID=A0A918WTK9_9ACTN|nr:hypothetical protein [Streptomyces finlayi]GGZ96563.1 hypothetical protein GCM10010329_17220 [Streptomyces spiroverticillatus]GHC81908.1 hypothetical protein GCM10010334_09700 [Streptomyces finlayi]